MSWMTDFWKRVLEASNRTDPKLFPLFKMIHELHTPVPEQSFTISFSGDGKNGDTTRAPYLYETYSYGVEMENTSRWEAWEFLMKTWCPFSNTIGLRLHHVVECLP